jgi:hypothetical protein
MSSNLHLTVVGHEVPDQLVHIRACHSVSTFGPEKLPVCVISSFSLDMINKLYLYRVDNKKVSFKQLGKLRMALDWYKGVSLDKAFRLDTLSHQPE